MSFYKKITTAKPPDKGLDKPKYSYIEPNKIHQADILYLPNDKGFKYLLVVVDVGSRLIDAQPLRYKTSNAVINAFEKIYSRDILKLPIRMEVDSGTEFKKDVKQFFEDNNIAVRIAKPGRHRQQAIVESKNKAIAYELYLLLYEKEFKTGKNNRQWLNKLPVVIQKLNTQAKPVKDVYKSPTCSKNCDLLEIGSPVLVKSDEPKDIENKRLPGKFRRADLKYELKIRFIKEFIISPNAPPMYLLDGNYGPKKVENIGYTKNQLLVLTEDDINILKQLKINKNINV
jgi:hypothetical protein